MAACGLGWWIWSCSHRAVFVSPSWTFTKCAKKVSLGSGGRGESHLHEAFSSCKAAATEGWARQDGGEEPLRVTRVHCWSESHHREEESLLYLALGMIKFVLCLIIQGYGSLVHNHMLQPQLPECVLAAGKAVLRGCTRDPNKFPGSSRLKIL